MSAATSVDPLRAMITGIIREVIAEMLQPPATVPAPTAAQHKADLMAMATMPSLGVRYSPQSPLGQEPKRTKRRMRRRKLPNYLTEPDAERLLRVVASEIQHYEKNRIDRAGRVRRGKLEAALQDEVLVHLGMFLGMRISEWVNLNVEHIDLAEKTLMVREGKGGKDRLLPIPDATVAVLRNWIGERKEGAMFLTKRKTRVGDRMLFWRIKRLGRLCGFRRSLNPHALRHTCASRMLDRGIDLRTIQDFLGHSSMAVTSIYLHISPDRMRAAANMGTQPRAPQQT
jgi:integrase